MLAYEASGEGLPVVLIHAFPLSHRIWREQISALKEISSVIAPDLPGFGDSPRQESPSIPQMATEIARLLDHLKVSKPVVVAGLSMGGYVAFAMYRLAHRYFGGLILADTRA